MRVACQSVCGHISLHTTSWLTRTRGANCSINECFKMQCRSSRDRALLIVTFRLACTLNLILIRLPKEILPRNLVEFGGLKIFTEAIGIIAKCSSRNYSWPWQTAVVFTFRKFNSICYLALQALKYPTVKLEAMSLNPGRVQDQEA